MSKRSNTLRPPLFALLLRAARELVAADNRSHVCLRATEAGDFVSLCLVWQDIGYSRCRPAVSCVEANRAKRKKKTGLARLSTLHLPRGCSV